MQGGRCDGHKKPVIYVACCTISFVWTCLSQQSLVLLRKEDFNVLFQHTTIPHQTKVRLRITVSNFTVSFINCQVNRSQLKKVKIGFTDSRYRGVIVNLFSIILSYSGRIICDINYIHSTCAVLTQVECIGMQSNNMMKTLISALYLKGKRLMAKYLQSC